MFTAECDYQQVHDWFLQSQFRYMFLFVSSYDYKDEQIAKAVIDNALRIDRITGPEICYLCFCENSADVTSADEVAKHIVSRVSSHDNKMNYDVGLTANIKVADQVCQRYQIMRYNLPAFILIDKQDNCSIYSIKGYEDFERVLSPINIINDYLSDIKTLPDDCNKEFESIRSEYIDRMCRQLNSIEGESFIPKTDEEFSRIIPSLLDFVKNQEERLSTIISHISAEVKEKHYDVFISCKSEDYPKAREIQSYLKENGYNPFLADTSLRDIGIDKYTLVIGQVLDACKSFILYSSHREYVISSYVTAEWGFFINEVNSGRKPCGKVINILTPDFDIKDLSPWLRDKQCLTTDNYKELLLDYLSGRTPSNNDCDGSQQVPGRFLKTLFKFFK